MYFGNTAHGIARRNGGTVELLDLPWRELGEALADGAAVGDLAAAAVVERFPFNEARLLAPLLRPRNVWGVGLAYRSHADEAAGHGIEYSGQLPALFLKASSSVTGPQAAIRLPRIAPDRVDYEGEIALVIGLAGREIDQSHGWDHVLGVTAANDVSARDVQRGKFLVGGMDFKGKSFDTFTPLGPWLVTPDEFADRDDIGLRTLVNGEVRQETRSSLLIWSVPEIVAAASQFATLEPGDVILTGTPAGVGMSSNAYLKPGDEVCVEIELVGTLRNIVAAVQPV